MRAFDFDGHRRFVARVSRKGVVTIPAEVRRKYGIEPEGAVLWVEENGELTLRTQWSEASAPSDSL